MELRKSARQDPRGQGTELPHSLQAPLSPWSPHMFTKLPETSPLEFCGGFGTDMID